MPRRVKAILLVRPREGKRAPLAWPDQVVVQIRRQRIGSETANLVMGFSVLVEYLPTTILPLDRGLILDIMAQWRQQYGSGVWDFYIKPEGCHPTLFDPRRKKIYFTEEG